MHILGTLRSAQNCFIECHDCIQIGILYIYIPVSYLTSYKFFQFLFPTLCLFSSYKPSCIICCYRVKNKINSKI